MTPGWVRVWRILAKVAFICLIFSRRSATSTSRRLRLWAASVETVERENGPESTGSSVSLSGSSDDIGWALWPSASRWWHTLSSLKLDKRGGNYSVTHQHHASENVWVCVGGNLLKLSEQPRQVRLGETGELISQTMKPQSNGQRLIVLRSRKQTDSKQLKFTTRNSNTN